MRPCTLRSQMQAMTHKPHTTEPCTTEQHRQAAGSQIVRIVLLATDLLFVEMPWQLSLLKNDNKMLMGPRCCFNWLFLLCGSWYLLSANSLEEKSSLKEIWMFYVGGDYKFSRVSQKKFWVKGRTLFRTAAKSQSSDNKRATATLTESIAGIRPTQTLIHSQPAKITGPV